MARATRAISLGVSVLIVILITVIVGFGTFLSGTLNTTSISNSSNSLRGSDTNLTTSPSQITTFLQTTESSSSSQSGLRLDLFVAPSNGSVGLLVINVDEYNTLDFRNNISLSNDWQYPQAFLNPYDRNCGAQGPVGFAVFQGNYFLQNYTTAKALTLYNPTFGYSCTTNVAGNYVYSFDAQSYSAILTNFGKPLYNISTSLSFSTRGYWIGRPGTSSEAVFQNFPPGNYTALAADEWGKVVLVHFSVTNAGLSSGTSAYTTRSVVSYSTSQVTVTTPQINWDYGQVANLTLNSPKVQSYIRDAYSYSVSIYPDRYGTDLITVIINVNGSLSAAGNYTDGYRLTYSGIKILNATVQFTQPSSYFLAGVGVTNVPDQTESITFSSQEQHIIQVALSNSMVQKFMETCPYYVEYMTQFPFPNGTYAGDYFVFMYPVNGTRTVGIFVNEGITAVVNTYTSTRVYTMCFGSSIPPICFTSPWNATS